MTTILIIVISLISWVDSIFPYINISVSVTTYTLNGPVFFLIGIIILAFASIELTNLLLRNKNTNKIIIFTSLFLGYLNPIAAYVLKDMKNILLILLILPIILLLVTWTLLLNRKSIKELYDGLCAVTLSYIWIGIPLGFLILIRQELDSWSILAIVLTIKSSDIGGWVFGNIFGRKKLIPWISPGKTWEGLAGGILFSIMSVFWILGTYIDISFIEIIFYGSLIAILGQSGDLMMSTLKRYASKKDSSGLFPTVGGMLDVIDSILLASPFIFLLLQ